MTHQLGILELTPAAEKPELLALPVQAALGSIANKEEVYVAPIDPTLSDTKVFCEQYQVEMGQAANCVIIEAKRGESRQFAACVVLATTRADVNGVVRKILDARKASFAPMEEAVTQSGMEFGAITPIGLPSDWPILIDRAVADSALVIVGSGIRASKIALPGHILAALPNAQVIDSLGKAPENHAQVAVA